MKLLRILPKDQIFYEDLKAEKSSFLFSLKDRNVYFTDSGKHAIRIISQFLCLNRDDEACIITTSDSPFVSSCVTSTLFNFCKISRVITDKTKLIFVIHEFGFPCEQIETIAEIAQKRCIPIVEDIAHSLTSYYNGKPLGSFGDYVIYSVPKSLRLDSGGILLSLTDKIGSLSPNNESVRINFRKESQYLHWAHDRRRYLFECLSLEVSKPLIYKLSEGVNPFCLAFKVNLDVYLKAIQLAVSCKIELLKTHNPGWITIALNPWYNDSDLARLVKYTRSIR